MPNPNELYADEVLIRSIELQSVATWLIVGYIARLEELQRELNATIARTEPDENNVGDVIALITENVALAYSELARRAEDDFGEIVDIQEEFERRNFDRFFGIPLGGEHQFESGIVAGSMLILGATLRQWIERQRDELNFRVQSSIRRSAQIGESVGKAIERLNGGADLSGIEATVRAIDPSKRALESIMRTSVEAAAHQVREATSKAAMESISIEPPPVIESTPPPAPPNRRTTLGYQQISVLDSRTTQICRDYAGKIWNGDFVPIGHKLPYAGGVPRHIYCRSSIVVIALDFDPVAMFEFAEWQNRLTEEKKKKIFGSKAYELFKAKKLEPSGLLRSKETQLTFDDLRKRNET